MRHTVGIYALGSSEFIVAGRVLLLGYRGELIRYALWEPFPTGNSIRHTQCMKRKNEHFMFTQKQDLQF